MFRVVLCCVLAVALGGCAVSRPDDMTTGSLDRLAQPTAPSLPDNNSGTSGKMPRAIASLPPEAGAVRRIAQTKAAEGLRQDILFDQTPPGLPQNAIDLRLRLSTKPTLDDPIVVATPTESGIKAELKTLFPRMTMQIVEAPRANAYGPYGLAIGRWDNGVRCLYAWQWIDDVKVANMDAGAHPASLRIRLCRSGLTLDQMAGFIDRLTLESVPQDDIVKVSQPQPSRTPPRLKRPAPRQVASRPAIEVSIPQAVAAPQALAARQDMPLDPSLPAAAYRGPIAATK